MFKNMRQVKTPGDNVVCGHCSTLNPGHPTFVFLDKDNDGAWSVEYSTCLSCKQMNIHLVTVAVPTTPGNTTAGTMHGGEDRIRMVWPRTTGRPPCPAEVPAALCKDYTQACLVLNDSPEASAALSRRCLQGVLREKGFNQKDLAVQIQAALDGRTLPTHIAEVLDVVRNVGNFAAHPMKSQSTGAILEVEPGEAEWNLDVLEALFDFYFVQEAAIQRRKDALNARLADTGKPPLKTP